jgi:hypothetical protein
MGGGMATVQSKLDTAFPDPRDRYDENYVALRADFLEALERNCIDLDLIASVATVGKIRGVLAKAKSGVPRNDLAPLDIELTERVIDELSAKIFLALSTRESDYYKHPFKGWEEIIIRFPNSIGDIEEAYKCFALARYAAAIFHSLQVVEAGLIEFGKLIGVTDPLPGWTATTGRLKKILDTKYPDRTRFEQENSTLLEQMHAAVHALQLAWRNKVSHVHGKLFVMTSDFHPEVAEEILVTSRALMRRLATEAPWPNASPGESS